MLTSMTTPERIAHDLVLAMKAQDAATTTLDMNA